MHYIKNILKLNEFINKMLILNELSAGLNEIKIKVSLFC